MNNYTNTLITLVYNNQMYKQYYIRFKQANSYIITLCNENEYTHKNEKKV